MMRIQKVGTQDRQELVNQILLEAASVKKSLLDLIAAGVIPAEKLRQSFDGMQAIESSAFELLTRESAPQEIFHDQP